MGECVMEFVITADIHADLFENLAVKGENLLTPRIEQIGEAFRQMCNYAQEHHIENVVVAGDLFHRRNLRTDSVNEFVHHLLKEYNRGKVEKWISFRLVVGNHDQANVSGSVTSLANLHEFDTATYVYAVPTIQVIDGFEFHFLPYEEHKGTADSIKKLLKQSKNPNRILVAHAGIAGAKISGFDHASREPLAVSDLQLDQYIYAYLGHYHEPQQIADNAMYVGALLQHSFKDCGSKRGFWHVTVELQGRKWVAHNKFIPIDAPEFFQLTPEEYKNGSYPDNAYLKVLGIDRVEKEALKGDPRIVGTTREEVESTEDKSLDLESSWEQQIEAYIDLQDIKKYRGRRLKKLGKEFV